MNASELLDRGLGKLAQPLPEGISGRLLAYLDLLEKWNHAINLTAIRERDRMVTQHLLDSLSVLAHLDAGVRSLADVGTGAGLPGIPLALARPDVRVTLIEPNQKKVAFLRQAKLELGLANAEVIGRRVEDVQEGPFDVVISRAFADLPDFVKVGQRLVAPAGWLIAMKGVVPYEEIGRLPLNATSRVVAVAVPELDATRHLIMVQFSASPADTAPQSTPRATEPAAGSAALPIPPGATRTATP